MAWLDARAVRVTLWVYLLTWVDVLLAALFPEPVLWLEVLGALTYVALPAVCTALVWARVSAILRGHRGARVEDLGLFLLVYLTTINLFAVFFLEAQMVLQALGMEGLRGVGEPLDYVYYSVMTMTTVGFGDMLPLHPITRAATAVEAVIGQLELVAGVGVVVGSLTGVRRD